MVPDKIAQAGEEPQKDTCESFIETGMLYDQAEKSKRVVIASRIYWPEPAAASYRWQAIEEELIRQGYAVKVLTSEFPSVAEGRRGKTAVFIEQEPGSSVVSRWPVLRDQRGNLRGYIPYLSFDIPLFFRLVTVKKPSVLLVEPPPTTGFLVRIVATMRSIPYVWYAPDIWFQAAKAAGAPSIVTSILRFVEGFAIRGAQTVLAVTEGGAEIAQELGAKDVSLIPNGIDTKKYYPRSESELCGVCRQEGLVYPYFIYAGTASEFQGASVFVEAFEKVLEKYPQTQLIFCGDGESWSQLEIDSLRINSRFGKDVLRLIIQGHRPAEYISSLLSGAVASLVSLAPGGGVETAYPTKVLASVASGCPVVYVGSGPALADIRNNSLGIICRYDSDAVADSMIQALENYYANEDNSEASDLMVKQVELPNDLREKNRREKDRMHRWAVENRSTARMARLVVKVVRQVIAS